MHQGKSIITGAAGFIGSHLAERMLSDGWTITGIDNFDDFYDPKIKHANIAECIKDEKFQLIEADIRDSQKMDNAIGKDVDVIVHLAARAGVRPSIAKPVLYNDVNINGTIVLLEIAKKQKIPVKGTIEASGGFQLISTNETITIDNTFEGILKRKKQDIRVKVGNMLFS